MPLLPGLPNRACLCDRDVSDHPLLQRLLRHPDADHDHPGVHRGIRQVHPAQQMRRDAVAGTEFQSPLAGDAARQARSVADADDLNAQAKVLMVPRQQPAEIPPVAAVEVRAFAQAVAAPVSDAQRVPKRPALALFLALRLSPELQRPVVPILPAQDSFQQAVQQSDDAMLPELPACLRRKRRSSPAQRALPVCQRRDGAVCHQHQRPARELVAAPRLEQRRGVAAQVPQQAQSHVHASRAPTAL